MEREGEEGSSHQQQGSSSNNANAASSSTAPTPAGGQTSFPGGGRTLGGSPANAPTAAGRQGQAPRQASRFSEEDVQKIMEFGVTREIAVSALEAAGGNLDVAASMLF